MQNVVLTGTVTFLIAFFGTFSNLLVLLSAQNMLSMNSSFGIITKNQALCNIFMCLGYLLYVFPMQMASKPIFPELSHYVGVFLMSIYEVSVASHLFIALNRLCTVFFPARYDKLFSYHLTLHVRNFIWLSAFLMCTILYNFMGCHFTFNMDSRSMEFCPECADLTWYSDFILNTSLVVVTLFINLLTLYKAGMNSKKRSVAVGIRLSIGQQKRKLNFLKQTFSQSAAIFTGQVAYYLIVPLIHDSLFEFFFATLWAYIHSLEGFIILTTNPDIRRYVFQSTCKRWRNVVSTVRHSEIVKHFGGS